MNLRSVGWRLSALLGFAGVVGLTAPSVVTEARATGVDVRADSGMAGYWEARTVERAEILNFTFDFDVDGPRLRGEVGFSRRDLPEPILTEPILWGGWVTGHHFQFVALGNWSGTLIGNELRLTRYNGRGGRLHIIAHRAARPPEAADGKAADLTR
jgi:hypothetical protein